MTVFISAAVQVEKTSTVSMIRALNIPMTFTKQSLFMEWPELIQVLGAALVVSSIAAVGIDFGSILNRFKNGADEKETNDDEEVKEPLNEEAKDQVVITIEKVDPLGSKKRARKGSSSQSRGQTTSRTR